MAIGASLHIGVDFLDPDHYAGWDGRLYCCEADADAMTALARARGFSPGVLKSRAATRDAVTASITAAAAELAAGDFFLLTYAGHGGSIADVDGDEKDMKDETWCLYDGELLDDELNILWSLFQPGVRVLVISDSCHSGSVSKGGGALEDADDARARFMPRDVARETFRNNRDFYANLQYGLPRPRPQVRATVRLLSGCQDDQQSTEKDGSGVFTRTLLDLWDEGQYQGDYAALYRDILAAMPSKQQPNHLVIGSPNPAYDREQPFTV